MDTSAVSEIAREIVENEFLFNWKYYAILVPLIFLVIAANNFLSAYFQHRGSSLATKTDFDQLLKQLQKTTETTESIKQSIAHEDWINRELKTTRRSKLEELMHAIYAAHHWLDNERNATLFDETQNADPDPINRIRIIAGLYFPELNAEIRNFQAAYMAYRTWLVESRHSLLQSREGNPVTYPIAVKEAASLFSSYYKPLLDATHALEEKAREVMNKVFGVSSPPNG